MQDSILAWAFLFSKPSVKEEALSLRQPALGNLCLVLPPALFGTAVLIQEELLLNLHSTVIWLIRDKHACKRQGGVAVCVCVCWRWPHCFGKTPVVISRIKNASSQPSHPPNCLRVYFAPLLFPQPGRNQKSGAVE